MRNEISLRVILLTAITCLLVMISCSNDTVQEANEKPFTIGIIAPLSGPIAAIGQSIVQGSTLAAEHIGDGRVKLILEDSAGDTKTAVSAFNKLATQDKPDAVIVATGAEAIIPIANDLGMPVIATFTSDPIPGLGDHAYRYFTHADDDAPILADKAIRDLKLESVDIIFSDSAYGADYDQAFTSEFEKHGGTVRIHESFPFMAQDVRTTLTKIAQDHPSGVYIIGLDFEILSVLDQMRKAGFPKDIKVLALGTITTQENIHKNPELVDGIYSSGFCSELPESYVVDFNKRWGSLPPYFSAFGYDSVHLIDKARQRAITLDLDLSSSLKGIGNFHGLLGDVQLNQSGEMHFEICPYQIQSPELYNLRTGEYFRFPALTN